MIPKACDRKALVALTTVDASISQRSEPNSTPLVFRCLKYLAKF